MNEEAAKRLIDEVFDEGNVETLIIRVRINDPKLTPRTVESVVRWALGSYEVEVEVESQ